jgi:hypothetical protein
MDAEMLAAMRMMEGAIDPQMGMGEKPVPLTVPSMDLRLPVEAVYLHRRGMERVSAAAKQFVRARALGFAAMARQPGITVADLIVSMRALVRGEFPAAVEAQVVTMVFLVVLQALQSPMRVLTDEAEAKAVEVMRMLMGSVGMMARADVEGIGA